MPPVAQNSGVVSAQAPPTPMDHSHPVQPSPHVNGGGGDGRGGDNSGGSGGTAPPAANGHASTTQSGPPQQHQPQPQSQTQPPQPQSQSQSQKDRQPNPPTAKKGPNQKDGTHGDNLQPSKQPQRASMAGPNDLFFGGGGGDDKSSGLSQRDREERLRQLRDRQQLEKQQKLEELKEHAAAAQRFREQQENERRRRLEDMRMRDADRRNQVEERKKIIQQAEQDRREAVLRKNIERDQRMESKRRNERSSIVFAFGSSTPRMLDPKDNSNYWNSRRATSTTNVHMVDSSTARRSSECGDMDLSRKRATSAHGLDRKPDGEDLMTRSMTAAIPATAARRRTDLMPAMPSMRDTGVRSSPRHRSPGMRSGTVTPNSPSRPTSALSQGSNTSSQVSYRPRTTPRKPRPLSIAGSSLSSADKPRDAALDSREGRPMERKLSAGSASSLTKPTRAKSAGSERSTPSTPARTPAKAATPAKPATPKKTPAQVKAENAAKKAMEKSKSTPKTKVTPKTTPLQSPSVESKPLVAKVKKSTSREGSTVEDKGQIPQATTNDVKVEEKQPTEEEQKAEKVEPEKEIEKPSTESSNFVEVQKSEEATKPKAETKTEKQEEANDIKSEAEKPEEKSAESESASAQTETETKELIKESVISKEVSAVTQVTKEEGEKPSQEVEVEGVKQEGEDKTPAQKAAEKPVTGYATEEEYKAALAEKRRLAREAKEREQELERQRQLEEEERERKEEEDYLKLIEEQRKAEEERLRKAIQEADRQRVEEAKRKEEEEKQREETERIEQQKRQEAEVRLKKEEEERQARKSRVAAIMARTRGKGGSSTPTKNESKTPSEEGKNFGDDFMSSSMTDSMIAATEAQLDSEEAAAAAAAASSTNQQQNTSVCSEVIAPESSQSQPQFESQPPTSSETVTSIVEMSSGVETIVSGVASVKLEEAHVNGDSPVPMETTPTHTVDLLGSLGDVNSVNLNGVDNIAPPHTSQGTDNLLDSLDPLSSSLSTTTSTTITSAASNFEQIIDLGQTKLNNEDAVNSNPPSPFIAFEQNLNKKPNQENTSSVPDLLL